MFRLFVSIYVLLLVAAFSYEVITVIALKNSVAYDWLIADINNDYAGTLYFLENLHKNLSVDDFKQIIANYPDHANIPLEILEFQNLRLSEQQLTTLRQNDLISTEDNNNLFDLLTIDTNIIIYYLLPNSDLVARIGPLLTYKPFENIADIQHGLYYLVLGLPVFLWVFSLQRKLQRLNHAATHFGEGDLSIRVSELSKHRVAQLNRSFNLMAERLERLVKGHKDLTNAIAHELRTPIARVLFQLDMLHQENEQSQRDIHTIGISEDLNELSDMVDELLTYARFDRQQLPSNMKPHSLHDSLNNIVHARQFEGEITIDYDENWIDKDSVQQQLPFEPKHLERAIGNLVSNAQKYAHSKVQIHVTQTKQICCIYVDDDGPGIPKHERQSIFEPFKRLDNSRTRSTGGFGLGLALVKQIAQLHSGELHIEQAPIGGARFIFSWPIDYNEIKELK